MKIKKLVSFFVLLFYFFFLSQVNALAAVCTPFTDDFTGTAANRTLWDVEPGSHITYSSTTGVKLSVPIQTANPTYKLSTINSKKNIDGNFSAEIISNPIVVLPGKYTAVGSLGFSITDQQGVLTEKSVYITRYANGGEIWWILNKNRLNWNGSTSGSVVVPNLTNNTILKFKIVREVSTIKLYYSVKSGTVFGAYKLIKSIPSFSSSTGKISIDSSSQAPDFPAVSASFDSLKVTCPSIALSPTPTITPSVTPGGPILTPTPTRTPTPNSGNLCVCISTGVCSSQCTFNKYPVGVVYNNPIKCNLPASYFSSLPTQAQKNDWCRRPNKTKGDSTGEDNMSLEDYFYYVTVKFGAKVPVTVNPDFNGDGVVNDADGVIIRKVL